MNRYQSIISAIVTFILIFVAPRLASHGIELDEASATTIVTGIVGVLAWMWTVWFNHNFTDEMFEATLIGREMKSAEDERDDEEGEE